MIETNTYYTHYKRGGRYRIVGIGTLQSPETESNGAEVIIYAQEHESTDYPAGSLWVRPVDMFLEDVIDTNGMAVKRFRRIDT